jgi:hypothetical protein
MTTSTPRKRLLPPALALLITAGTLLLLCGCAGREAVATSCNQLCDELVDECGYPAFPDEESCLQGCAYNEGEGADTEAHLDCVQEAACNTFDIISCENSHGATSDD